ncbi:MAG: mechanosensitive ion channel protein MscS, partial [Nitrosospira sp.]|nr:mechanosensitive ion channel protein MscS [Nitrosospira sp.]
MPPNNEIHSLLLSLITDIQEVTILWQLGVLLSSLGLAWLAQRLLAERISSQVRADNTPVISASNFNRLMT